MVMVLLFANSSTKTAVPYRRGSLKVLLHPVMQNTLHACMLYSYE